MANDKNRQQWKFVNHALTKISPNEVVYWKKMLEKILKCGIEFEFNLPDKNGSCKGDNAACPCNKITSGDSCWLECIHGEECKATNKNVKELCANGAICTNSSCNSCTEFEFKCLSINCVNFMSNCIRCAEFVSDCNTCTSRFVPEKNPDTIREKIKKQLDPSMSYGKINQSGVHSITTDGSLLGGKGVEIITIGRRIDYREFHTMAKGIIDAAVSRGAWVNERCSSHMHLLASYYSKTVPEELTKITGIPNYISELERPLPEIILANLHQLIRRYQNPMTWMTMGLDNPERLTRWEKFRVSVIPISAIKNSMAQVKDLVSSAADGTKYGWINYKYTEFDKNGDITRLHIELRAADNLLSPSAVAAIACMYYALVIKAVEISRYGIVEVGNQEWLARAKEIKNAMLNNRKHYNEGDRFSDTSELYKYYDILKEESIMFVNQLKHILMSIGPAYEVLEKLADKPIALRRVEGDTWEKIEKDLAVEYSEEDELEAMIHEWIDLQFITNCKNLDEWISVLTDKIDEETGHNSIDKIKGTNTKERIQSFISSRRNDGDIIWNDKLGTVTFL